MAGNSLFCVDALLSNYLLTPNVFYKVRQKITTKIFCSFLSHRLEFQSEIIHMHAVILYAHNILSACNLHTVLVF